MKLSFRFWGILVVWLALFVTSIISAVTAAPQGDGFTRGMNRLVSFGQWQIAALVVALISFLLARTEAAGLSRGQRFLGKTPFYAHGIVLLGMVGAIVYAVLTAG